MAKKGRPKKNTNSNFRVDIELVKMKDKEFDPNLFVPMKSIVCFRRNE